MIECGAGEEFSEYKKTSFAILAEAGFSECRPCPDIRLSEQRLILKCGYMY
jgi:hypothetical protein